MPTEERPYEDTVKRHEPREASGETNPVDILVLNTQPPEL